MEGRLVNVGSRFDLDGVQGQNDFVVKRGRATLVRIFFFAVQVQGQKMAECVALVCWGDRLCWR